MKITIENYDEKHTFETESEGLTISEMIEHFYCLLHSVGYGADSIRDAFIEKGFQLDEFHFVKEREPENVELHKDKERLDWLQSSDLTLHSWEEGDVWGSKGAWTIREFIDEEREKDL
jgi:hypothetical protein